MNEQDRKNIDLPLESALRISSLAAKAYASKDAEVADIFEELSAQIDQARWCLSNTQ